MNNRILIVDDHPAVRMAIQLVLASEGYDVVAQAENGRDALALLEQAGPLTLILDIAIPQVDGLGVIRGIAARGLPVKIVVMSGLPSAHLSARCLRMGAHAFVSKQDPLTELVKAVAAVRANQQYFPKLAQQTALGTDACDEHELLKRLSTREFMILQHLLQGLGCKDIGLRLEVSIKTVSTFKTRIFHKLNVGSLMDLYALGERNNLT